MVSDKQKQITPSVRTRLRRATPRQDVGDPCGDCGHALVLCVQCGVNSRCLVCVPYARLSGSEQALLASVPQAGGAPGRGRPGPHPPVGAACRAPRAYPPAFRRRIVAYAFASGAHGSMEADNHGTVARCSSARTASVRCGIRSSPSVVDRRRGTRRLAAGLCRARHAFRRTSPLVSLVTPAARAHSGAAHPSGSGGARMRYRGTRRIPRSVHASADRKSPREAASGPGASSAT
jgi:hypothetical protein